MGKLLGAILLAAPLIGLMCMMGRAIGWKATLSIVGASTVFTGMVVAGVVLLCA